MINNTLNLKEEFSSKIPALTLLTNLGYQFIPPSQYGNIYGNSIALFQLLLISKRRVKVNTSELTET